MNSVLRGVLASALLTTVLPAAVLAADLTVGLTADPSHLDPQAGEELSSNIMFYHLYDPLVRRNADLTFSPGLAESWEVVDDTTWRFKLREGVTFHNGNPFNAEDVVYTIERARASIRPGLVKNIASEKAVDDLTVEITTPAPYAVLPAELAELLILDKDYTEGLG